ncbi:MAG: host attachment family protein [Burkholderiaceae bacterium]
MAGLKVPKDALVMVGDGEKALFLRNKGTPDSIKLEIENILEQDNPASHEQGTDKPGRAFASAGTARSAMEEVDWHQLGEDRFASQIAQALYKLAHANKFDALVVVAPPKVLGVLRKEFHKEVTDRITGELSKELASQYVPDIEKALNAQV